MNPMNPTLKRSTWRLLLATAQDAGARLMNTNDLVAKTEATIALHGESIIVYATCFSHHIPPMSAPKFVTLEFTSVEKLDANLVRKKADEAFAASLRELKIRARLKEAGVVNARDLPLNILE